MSKITTEIQFLTVAKILNNTNGLMDTVKYETSNLVKDKQYPVLKMFEKFIFKISMRGILIKSCKYALSP